MGHQKWCLFLVQWTSHVSVDLHTYSCPVVVSSCRCTRARTAVRVAKAHTLLANLLQTVGLETNDYILP